MTERNRRELRDVCDPIQVTPDPKPRRQETCKRGHSLADAPVRNGSRHCRECDRARNREYKRRNRERVREANRDYKKRHPAQRREVTCPDCRQTRLVFAGSAMKRCRSCAAITASGTGEMKMCRCGEYFYVGAKRLASAQFCSRACRKKYGYAELGQSLSRARQGKGNPAYRHGRRVGVQIPGWRLKFKGEHACRNCGTTSGRIELHHAVPRGKTSDPRRDDLRNGLPLCQDCHTGWHAGRVTLHRDLFRPDEWAFISTLELTGQRIEAWLEDHYPVMRFECSDPESAYVDMLREGGA